MAARNLLPQRFLFAPENTITQRNETPSGAGLHVQVDP